VKCYIWSIALYGAETRSEVPGKFWNVVLEKVSLTDRVNNEAILHRVKEERNILQTTRRRKANWIGHTSLKERLEGQEGEEGDVSSRWMTWRKQEDTGSWRRKLRIELFGKLSLEEAMNLSLDRLLLELLELENAFVTFALSNYNTEISTTQCISCVFAQLWVYTPSRYKHIVRRRGYKAVHNQCPVKTGIGE
jgi:hypothetical protein